MFNKEEPQSYKQEKTSSAASAAHAIIGHLKSWLIGSEEIVSMGVICDGSYGIAKDIVYSFPVTCSGGDYHVVQGLSVSEFARKKMDATAKELLEEKQEAFSFLS